MAALVNHVGAQTSSGTGVTTGSVSMTGATTLIAAVGSSGASNFHTITDSSSNHWLSLGGLLFSASESIELFLVFGATVSGAQTFTVPNTINNASIAVMGFSGLGTSASEWASVNNASATTLSGGTCPTLPVSGVSLTALVYGTTGTASVDSSFTITDKFALVGGTALGIGFAYLLGTGNVSPTWTITGSAGVMSAAVTALSGSGGGATTVGYGFAG